MKVSKIISLLAALILATALVLPSCAGVFGQGYCSCGTPFAYAPFNIPLCGLCPSPYTYNNFAAYGFPYAGSFVPGTFGFDPGAYQFGSSWCPGINPSAFGYGANNAIPLTATGACQ
ncbi:hypothetical protein [Methanooceanicella nereidis]|nr:hypothetical protein [Methanocella sp. CWC-04]